MEAKTKSKLVQGAIAAGVFVAVFSGAMALAMRDRKSKGSGPCTNPNCACGPTCSCGDGCAC